MSDLDRHLPAILAGDTRAFGQWMAGCEVTLRDSLRGFARAVDTEAVVQETFLRVWQVAPRFTPDGKANGLVRMAMRIARNLAISETRRLRTASAYRDRLAGQGEVAAPALRSAPDPLLREAIDICREQLPDKPAQALSARLSSAGAQPDLTLARALGMTKNTFLQNITRARRFLAKCLAERGVDVEAEMT
ncbi:MAG: sigma-70 family RNA polymerase sigma factor [Myxococcota bacterium]